MATEKEVQEERAAMLDLAKEIDVALNGELKGDERLVGFALICFPFGAARDGRVNYVGNGDRESVRLALRELLLRMESTRQ